MPDRISCKAIIFDFDGTLADSMPFLERIGVAVMMKYHGVTHEEATWRYRTTTGLPYEQQVKINFPGHEKNDMAIKEFEALKIQRIYEQSLFPDTVSALMELKGMGLDLFVSSSTFQSTITEYFKRRSLGFLFRDIMGYRPGFEKGAHHFNYVKNTYGLQLDHVVFVGDSIKDYERSRGFCPFVGMVGMVREDDFRAAGHTGPVVRQLSDVPGLVTVRV
ncbi:MAG: HAD family hydrolase [Candidatus Thorarchaeota archaeon]|nr:HAD family hydrolase [Candidatus Thorarchaeota archaeon]